MIERNAREQGRKQGSGEGENEKRRKKGGINVGREGEYIVLELQRSIINADKRSITFRSLETGRCEHIVILARKIRAQEYNQCINMLFLRLVRLA